MTEERHDPEFLKHIFDTTQVLRKPVSGIIAGYHVLPYILVGTAGEPSVRLRRGARQDQGVAAPRARRPGAPGRPTAICSRTPTSWISPGRAGLLVRVLLAPPGHPRERGSEIQRSDRDPETQIERALDELAQREVINTGVILAPDVRFYPVSLDRFITEILDQEFRPS